MNYFTAIANSPTYEFPYSGYQANSGLHLNNDINAMLSGFAPTVGSSIYNQSPSITLQCVPKINAGVGDNTVVYQVPENMPIDMILQYLGVNANTLQPSNMTSNYYRTASQPMEMILPPSSSPRSRRMICREISDSDDDGYLRRPSSHQHRHHSDSWHNEQEQPPALHNMLNRVWQNAERGSRNLPSSSSAPDLNSIWQSMRNSSPPSPRNSNTNNAWEAMRNASAPLSPEHQNAVNRVWQRADYASEIQGNRSSDMFNRMRPPNDDFNQPPPFLNPEAVRNFNVVRNLPYGINTTPPPFPNREAVQNFNTVRNLPYGANTTPPPSNAAVNNFLAARYVPSGFNQPNPAVANVWNRAGQASQQGPPMINVPWNQGTPPSPSMPVNNAWNRMQQGAMPPFNPSYPPSPMGMPQRGPAPASFASLLSQAHRRGLPYAGVA